MSKPKGFDLLPQTPAIVALRQWAESDDEATSTAAMRDYCAARTQESGDPAAGLTELAVIIGRVLRLETGREIPALDRLHALMEVS